MKRRTAALLLAAVCLVALAVGALVPQRAHIARSLKRLGLGWRASEPDPPKNARAAVRCDRVGRRISPLIFGVSGGGSRELSAKADRLGGNGMTRYNWQLGDAWNTGADWYFRNVQLS